jgi:DNA-binding MarR family transcriptional regulator
MIKTRYVDKKTNHLFLRVDDDLHLTRIHISKLIKNNWISINTCSKDSRVKIIKPTAKMLDTFNALSNELRTSRKSKNKKILSFKSFIKR